MRLDAGNARSGHFFDWMVPYPLRGCARAYRSDVFRIEYALASSEQIQELIRAHFVGDQTRFRSIALQVAATEARAGHRLVASKIRDLLEEAGAVPVQPSAGDVPTPIARPAKDLRGVLAVAYPTERLKDIVLAGAPRRALERLLVEQRSRDRLAHSGLAPRRKVLLFGPPGCGKTLAARVIAGELGLPLLRVRVETLFSRYLGETASLLASIFDEMARVRGVYLFDEFDAIGRQRAEANDVGEAKRIVSTFLQLVDADESGSLVVAATNARGAVDQAMFRRFDDVCEFPAPGIDDLFQLLRMRFADSEMPTQVLRDLAERGSGLSFADMARIADEARKTAVLNDRSKATTDDLSVALNEVLKARPPA